ncbi:uncharacterized protein LOC124932218 [Impatiens glandulifera]|uniref:uncharacterized protein LOC124932218 n=1 Tax=Impatiens glandulifera TaxID=253017 RepID=UPI001FB1476F|nr:uncharacterized protein LOC124932218 [Impatiens glandulifera]
MEQSNAASEEEETDLVDFFNQDESAIADILLLLSNSKPRKPIHDKGNHFTVTHQSQSFLLPDWASKKRRSTTNRAVRAPPSKKELPPSPATPLLFSSSESEDKLNRKIRVTQKKKRQVLKKNVEGLVGCRETLRVELQKVGTYHSQLQEINLALKTMKQDLSTTVTTTTASNNGNGYPTTMHNNNCVVIQQLQQQQPYNMFVNQTDASCPSSLNCSWQTQIQNFQQSCRNSSSSQLGMGALLYLSSSGPQLVVNKRPDLNAPSESGYLFNVHPSDLRRTFSDAEKKAKYAAARKLRMNNNRMKQTRRMSSSSSTAKIKMQTFMSR